MLTVKMCQLKGCYTLWTITLFMCVFLFSASDGRPKESVSHEQVVEMKVDTSDSITIGPSRDTAPEEKHGNNDDRMIEPKGKDETGDNKAPAQMQKPTEEEATMNVHDVRSRAMAEQLKRMPFQAGDAEEIMHGGHHVHGLEQEGPKQAIGVGGLDMTEMVDGGAKKEEEKTAPSTLDTEQLMHVGEGEEHGHNPHEGVHETDVGKKEGPSANNPEDLLHIRDVEIQEEEKRNREPAAQNPEESLHFQMDHGHKDRKSDETSDGDGQKVGVSVEEVVHGDEHAHDHQEGVTEEYVDEDGITKTRKLGKLITMEDIQNLGLSQKDLEGIDLGKLLRRDKDEYDAWKKDHESKKDKGFWEKVDEFRNNYFNMLSKQIRHLSRLENEEDPEWEGEYLDDDPHPGESRVDHEAELWGSTKTKGNRRRRSFTVIHRPTHEGTEEL